MLIRSGRLPILRRSMSRSSCSTELPVTLHQIYTVACVVASRSANMPTLIGMRCVQATGSSAVVAVGAGSLADMFEVHERGQKVSRLAGFKGWAVLRTHSSACSTGCHCLALLSVRLSEARSAM